MAYVYTHTRLDSNEVFYVGIGEHKRRAYDKRRRNKYWYHIVNKHGYKVNVTHEDVCWEEACAIEEYLIAFYGRADLKAGTLVNMTDGGEGTLNKSEESKRRQMETAKRNGTFDKMCERMRYYAKVTDKSGINSNVRKDAYVYDRSGKFVWHYVTISEFCRMSGASTGNASAKMDTGMQVKGYYVFSKHQGDLLSSDKYTIVDMSKRARENTKKIPVKLLDKNNGSISFFETMDEASKFLGRSRAYVSKNVSDGRLDLKDYKIILE